MAQHTITFAVSDALREGDPVARFFEPVASAWRSSSKRPGVRPVTLDALLVELSHPGTPSFERLRASPLLAVMGTDVRGAALAKLVDAVQQASMPAVVLVPTADRAAQRLQGGGVLIETHDAEPAVVAAMLLALAERQGAVVELERDLQVHRRYEGGVRGEIDRIHDELNLAQAVQRELLPATLPDAGGVRFAALFRPAGYVSGDIYDVTRLDARHVGFFIADAVGHGVPAALMTMVIARALRTTRDSGEPGAPRQIVPPGEAMSLLNDELCRGHAEASPRFSTAIYGVIDTVDRTVRLVGAGHPPPLRIRGLPGLGLAGAPHASMRRVETDGPLLGVFPGEVYSETTFTLEPGETLLLYSDGFETAFPAGEATAIARRNAAEIYLDELAALPWPDGHDPSLSAGDALSRLARRIDEQSGSLHQVDDVTALAITVADAEETVDQVRDAGRVAA